MGIPTPAPRGAAARVRVPRVAAAVVALAVSAAASGADVARPWVVLIGDTQRTLLSERLLLREQNDAVRAALLQAVAAADPRLVVVMGDAVAKGGDAGAWRYFDRVTAPLRARGIPIAGLLGNHEYFGDRRTMIAEASAHFAPFGPRSWNVVRSGAIALVLLDSNFERLGAAASREQDEWYAAELARLERDDSVRFVVVCSHHPPFTNSTIVSPSPEVERRFVPPFLASSKAVLFASGHCHSYERFRHHGKDFIVTGGGGGPRQRVQVDPRRRRFEDLFAGPPIRPFHYCRLDVEGGRLAVTMVCVDPSRAVWGACDRFVAGEGAGPHP